ncbi:Ubiquitin carboxyl-terminal hydrolase family protein [Trichomonas vaginalis G3]|uniref:Ubiquitin carboxyl-terminal hydrolase family protein n=1 Tax=Trichomonas vaginalis (strain ATCC PRA-98 / G3) TaxID=412133 RepID=A2GAC0_TRIV3|nr:Ubiquitin carboxyl-terminal hydrolase family protein [Trichomonas vaginalis G3]|eukprot:XP_001298827.1 Ubiquitin carboxyl-terminal hydrolase family protein [Trichomonas vaginalis G3]
METKKSLLDLLNEEDEEEEDGNYVGSDMVVEEEEINSENSENEDDQNQENFDGKVEPTNYEFDVEVNPNVIEDGIFQSEEFSTNQHSFHIGFYTLDPDATDVYLFVYPQEFKKSFECSFSITVPETEIDPLSFYGVFNEEFPLVKSPKPLLDKLPTEPFKIHVFLSYIPGPNESRKYFNCVGLNNDGMTCYLNSLTQALFHIRGFRKIVFNIDTEKSEIPKALASLFYNMQTSSKSCSTRRLTKSFGWNTEDLFAQQDVQELMRILLDRLDSVSDNSASKMFKGVFKSYIRVPILNYESSHNEDFYDLSLVVRGCLTLEESIKQFFEPDQMTGADQYQMPDKTKVDALKGFELIESPSILCLHLRRFEYINGDMQKITSRFEFEEDLHFGDDNYKLITIIAHAGSFFGGHYCAFVHKDEKWLCFDDDFVSEITEQQAIEEKYGGDNHGFTAYVLFYCKESQMDTLINCADPVITKTVLDDIEKHKTFRDVMYVNGKDFAENSGTAKKAQIPRDGPLDQIKEVFSKICGFDMSEIVLRNVDPRDHVREIVTEENFSSVSKFFISNNSNIPVFPKFYVDGYDLKPLETVFVEEMSSVEDLSKVICQTVGISDEPPLKCFTYDDFGSTSEVDFPIVESLNLIFQLADKSDKINSDLIVKNLDMKEYLPPKDSPFIVMGKNLQIENAGIFFEMTNDMEYITFRHIINKDQKFKLLVPLLFSYENILKLISCKLQKNSDQILLFKPNDVRSLHKSTHPNVKAILEAMDMIDPSDDMTICFDIAPESVKTVDRSDITVIDKNGKTKQRFAIYLPPW